VCYFEEKNVVCCVIIARSQKGEAGHPSDGQDHEEIRRLPHEMLLAQSVAVPMVFHGVVSMGQQHQNEGSPI
jgi:hypothetical protein